MLATSHARIATITLFSLVAGYSAYAAHRLFAGPSVVVRTPTPGQTVTEPLTTIRGKVSDATRVLVNGRPITTDTSGGFEEKLVTPSGYGVVLVEAENRFGYHTTQRIELYGRPPAPHVSINHE